MLRAQLAVGGLGEQRPFGLRVEVGEIAAAAQAVAEGLAQPLFGQLKLVLGSLELGDLLADKGFAAQQGAGAEVEAQRIDHELLGKDHAQIGGLAHGLAQAGGEVAPVDDRVEHLAGVLRVGRVGVFGLGAEGVLVVGAGVGGIGAVVGAQACFGGIDGEDGVDVARLAQVGVGQVDALLERQLADHRVGVAGAEAALLVEMAHQRVEVVEPAVGEMSWRNCMLRSSRVRAWVSSTL